MSAMRANYQSQEPCIACGTLSIDRCYHHIVARKRVAPIDEPWNLLSLDARHHAEVHQIGLSAFAKKWPMVRMWLIYNGWEFDEFLQKWRRYEGSHHP